MTLELYDEVFPCTMLHYASATFVPIPSGYSSRRAAPRAPSRRVSCAAARAARPRGDEAAADAAGHPRGASGG